MAIEGFSMRCPFCNSEVEPVRTPRPEDPEPEEWICRCGAGTEGGKWQELKPGWLKEEMDDVAAYERARKRILQVAGIARKFGYTQPSTIELTQPELRALAYMMRE